MRKGTLDTAVDSLIEDVRSKVLDAKDVGDDTLVIMDGRVEISFATLNQLRPGRWLDNWMVMAGIQMSDKPFFINYGQSVPLSRALWQESDEEYPQLTRWR